MPRFGGGRSGRLNCILAGCKVAQRVLCRGSRFAEHVVGEFKRLDFAGSAFRDRLFGCPSLYDAHRYPHMVKIRGTPSRRLGPRTFLRCRSRLLVFRGFGCLSTFARRKRVVLQVVGCRSLLEATGRRSDRRVLRRSHQIDRCVETRKKTCNRSRHLESGHAEWRSRFRSRSTRDPPASPARRDDFGVG